MHRPVSRFALLFLILQFCLPARLAAQESTPYSRFGLGYTVDNNTMASAMMGGLGATYRSADGPNYINPASYSAVRYISFDAGISGNFNTLKTETRKNKNSNFAFNYLSLTLPVKKFWVTSAGLLPFSNKNYLISQTDQLDTAHTVKIEYEGSGSLYNLYWGNGFSWKGLAVGINMGYLFGKLDNNTFAYPVDPSGNLDQGSATTWNYNDVKASSFFWNAGVQYSQLIKNKKDSSKVLVIDYGLSGNAPFRIKGGSYLDQATYGFQTKYLVSRGQDQSLVDFINEVILPRAEDTTNYKNFLDTLSENFGQKLNIKVPGTLNVGIAISNGTQWRAGVDFRYQPWSKYLGYENNSASKLYNSWRVAAGGEFMPGGKNLNKFFNRVRYRAGFHYHRTNIRVNDNAVNEFGIDFGVGIPLPTTVANDEGMLQKVYTYAFNLGFEAGKRGSTTGNLVQENFFRLKIGFTLNDRWFVKRKYY